MITVYGVTFDDGGNYGSFSQCYALQQAIMKLRIAGQACDYKVIPVAKFPFRRLALPYSKLPHFAKRALKYLDDWIVKSHFKAFNKEHMRYADCKDETQLARLNDTADAFVCGSDVIWNLYFNWGNPVYFLSFAKKYMFSYAVSFGGMTISDKADKMYREYLPRFRSIGLREKSAIEIVKKYVSDVPIEVNMDPVLLLTKEEWEQVIPSERKKQKYILAYNTHITPSYTAMVEKIQKQTGLKVVNVTCFLKTIIKQRIWHVPSPQEWWQLIRDAEYVVTNSFHGTVFSIIFNKTFFTTVEGSGKGDGFNVRIYDLLSTLNLGDRIYNAVPEHLNLSKPDFTVANERLPKLRNESLDYIKRNLEAAYQEKIKLEQKG